MRLLLAEDERDLSSILKRLFEYNKFDVECVYDGATALDFATYEDFDIIVLDVMMPKMNGFDVVENIRRRGKSTPVLMLTARAEIDDKVLGLDCGADDYMTKPFQTKELLARVRALLRRKSEIVDSYKIGNVTLNHETFSLEAEKTVRLTNKEYKLMETLIRNKNSWLSTERIMDLVWDLESDAEINVVWAYLSALRKKLEQIGANVVLASARGVGYRLEVKE